jgi:uncharacterized protein (DUF362 family)
VIDRRTFLQLASASAAAAQAQGPRGKQPEYNIVSAFDQQQSGYPGQFPSQVVCVQSDRSVNAAATVDPAVVREMMDAGMKRLTGAPSPKQAWARFIQPSDIVGVKLNCSGAPQIHTSPEVASEIVRNLMEIGVPANHIYLYDRFADQIASAGYEKLVPEGTNIIGIEKVRDSPEGYDPKTYVDVNFFGEENTRSSLVRLVTQTFTKIVNVPVMKEHGAAGVTGCLKNIAYGNFSNVARSHQGALTHTYSFIGTLAGVEPLRSKSVLNIMDGLNGVWHGGPFSSVPEYRFSPKQIFFGTDPVAMDRLLIDVIEAKRKQENAVSIWDRGKEHVQGGGDVTKPNFNHFVREPGHIEMAGNMGLGEYDKAKIKRVDISL